MKTILRAFESEIINKLRTPSLPKNRLVSIKKSAVYIFDIRSRKSAVERAGYENFLHKQNFLDVGLLQLCNKERS